MSDREDYRNTEGMERSFGRSRPKKMKTSHEHPTFTKTEYIDAIQIGDKFVSVIGYVDSVRKTTIKQKDPLYDTINDVDLIRCVLNNNRGDRVSCVAWGDNAAEIKPQIKYNLVYWFQNLTAEPSSTYNNGSVPLELEFKYSSKISNFGLFEGHDPEKITPTDIPDVPSKIGIIKIEGYVKDEFIRVSRNHEDTYSGTVTDDHYKLEIVMKNVINAPLFPSGQRVQIVGDVQTNEYHFFLMVHNPNYLKILNDPPMPLHESSLVLEMLSRDSI